MIYRREEFFQEDENSQEFPLRQVEVMNALDGSSQRFIGRVSLGVQTPMGVTTVPVSFEIKAGTIHEAFARFDARAREELEKAKAEIQDQISEMRRQSQSRIITPGEVTPGDLNKLKL